MMLRPFCLSMALIGLCSCVAWSAPQIVPIRGPLPRQILILPVVDRIGAAVFRAELDAEIGVHVEGRGYQVIRPGVAGTLFSSYGWDAGVVDPGALPLDELKRLHEVDAVLVTQLVDWQVDRQGGRYRYRLRWSLIDCATSKEVWAFADGGQVAPEQRREATRIVYPEDVALGPGPVTRSYRDRPITSGELAHRLQKRMSLRLPLADVDGSGRGWRER